MPSFLALLSTVSLAALLAQAKPIATTSTAASVQITSTAEPSTLSITSTLEPTTVSITATTEPSASSSASPPFMSCGFFPTPAPADRLEVAVELMNEAMELINEVIGFQSESATVTATTSFVESSTTFAAEFARHVGRDGATSFFTTIIPTASASSSFISEPTVTGSAISSAIGTGITSTAGAEPTIFSCVIPPSAPSSSVFATGTEASSSVFATGTATASSSVVSFTTSIASASKSAHGHSATSSVA